MEYAQVTHLWRVRHFCYPLFMRFTEPDKVPAWPPVLSSFSDVSKYLLSKKTASIGTATYEVDFYRPMPGSYARDKTAYTTDDPRTRYVFIMFGKLREAPVRLATLWSDVRSLPNVKARLQGRHHFTLEGSQELPEALQSLYDAQLEVLSAPVLADDLIEDVSTTYIMKRECSPITGYTR